MQIAVYLVKTLHLLLYNNRSASLKLNFRQCTTLGLLETTTQLRQSLAIFKITTSATGERQTQ